MSLRSTLGKIRRLFLVKVKEVERPYEINLLHGDRFKGQVAVVTGGSGVIGRAICYRLASEGAIVYACGTNSEKLSTVVEEITKAGYKAFPLCFNLKNDEEVETAFKKVFDDQNRIDLMVHCAGGGARKDSAPLIQQKMDIIDNVLSINLRAAILCTREACRYMIQRNFGKIILISSTVGVQGLRNYSEYAAAKAGIMAFVKSIAMELGKDGIRINCVTPGIVQRGTIDEDQMDHIKKTNWLNSYGKPEDISAMVAFLNSDEADFITGQNYLVEGGRSLGLKF